MDIATSMPPSNPSPYPTAVAIAVKNCPILAIGFWPSNQDPVCWQQFWLLVSRNQFGQLLNPAPYMTRCIGSGERSGGNKLDCALDCTNHVIFLRPTSAFSAHSLTVSRGRPEDTTNANRCPSCRVYAASGLAAMDQLACYTI